jgi:O-antigen ligase
VAAAGLAALVLGALVAYSPVMAIAAALAIGYVGLVVRNLPLALALWVPLIFFEGQSGMGYLPEAAGLLLALGWLGVLARSRTSGERGGRMPALVLAPLAALTLLATASLLWAQDPKEALPFLVRFYSVVVVFAILVNCVTSRRALVWILVAFAFGAALSVVYGILTGLSAPTADTAADTATVAKGGRLQGGVGDPNFLAAALISAAALVGAIAMAKRARFGVRMMLLVAGIIMPIGVLSTGSRGGIAAAVAAILLTLVFLRGYRRRVAALVLVGIIAVTGYAMVSPVAPLERLELFGDRGSGREDLWTVGWRMTEDYPLLGVGFANFTVRAKEYAREPGSLTRVSYISEQGQEVHNLYLQATTELGFAGLGLLLVFVFACIRSTWQAERRFRRSAQRRMATFARLVIIAQVSMLAADFFLSALVDKRLWVILALGPILATIAAREAASQPATALT